VSPLFFLLAHPALRETISLIAADSLGLATRRSTGSDCHSCEPAMHSIVQHGRKGKGKIVI
jgi:bacterioferritin-associated ferredoxin